MSSFGFFKQCTLKTSYTIRNPFLTTATSFLQALQGPVLWWLRLRHLAWHILKVLWEILMGSLRMTIFHLTFTRETLFANASISEKNQGRLWFNVFFLLSTSIDAKSVVCSIDITSNLLHEDDSMSIRDHSPNPWDSTCFRILQAIQVQHHGKTHFKNGLNHMSPKLKTWDSYEWNMRKKHLCTQQNHESRPYSRPKLFNLFSVLLIHLASLIYDQIWSY